MKAVLWHAVSDIRLDTIPEPTDAVVRLRASAICGTDLHFIRGTYPLTAESFPIGNAMDKNLTVKMGHCHHRRYRPKLVRLVASDAIDSTRILTQRAPLTSAIEAYQQFDLRHSGWAKVKLEPAA